MATFDARDDQPAFHPRLLNRLVTTARIGDAVVMIVAVLVLIGWCFNIEVLRSVIPGLTAMNPGGTALAFLLAGGSLWCLIQSQPTPQLRQAARIMASIVVILGLLRLIQYLFGLEWGPDQWLFREKLDLYQPPNRMAPNTALGLLLIGIALLLFDVEPRRGLRPAQWFALAAALLAMLALVGYACNATMLVGIQTFIPMALNSAATLALLATSVMFAHPDKGLMAVVCNRNTGGVMARRLLPTAILAPTLFAWLASLWQRAGSYDPSFGISLFVVSTIVLFVTLIWWNANSLNEIDDQRTRTQKELDSKNSILKSVVNSMGDGVVVADREGHFLLFNPVAERILGLGAIDAPPSEWTDQYGLFSPETGQPLGVDDIPLVKAIRGESTTQQDLLIKNPQLPEGVHISVTGRPLKGDDGIEGGVVVFQDTTQRRRAAEAIRHARDEADAANRAKSEFLANMSHEIRTPMNAVIGMTELVLDSELSDMQRTYLKIVQDSAESLLLLINDILDFSKIEAGKLELDHAQFQLRDVLGDAMKTLSVRTRGRDLELACHVAPEVPEYLIGDPHRLRQVVTNLVGNAIKFTEKGEVVLDVSLNDISRDQVQLHVKVRDTGIGIPPDKLHLLFSAFSQVDASTTRRYGGTGLGLAITARLVSLMNGKTWVESEPGKGSTFHFTAKIERDCSPPPPPATPEALQKLRVLIVDDNATNRLILQEMVSGWGMRSMALSSADSVIEELHRAVVEGDPYRIVLSDVHMPGVDGFQLASRIRQDGQIGSTVIMMLSSGAGPGDVARCRELGAATHLIKPVKSSELYASIASVMGMVDQDKLQHAIATKAARPLKILLAEDSRANQQLALGVLGKWGHSLTIANNGREAVEAFNRGVYDVVLMDVQMPDMDGVQATAQIREIEQKQGSHVPIVAMTAHAMKGDREEFIRSGMDDYVTKPIRWVELRRVLDNVIATTNVDQACETSPTTASEQSLEWKLNWDEALRSVDGNEQLLGDIMQILLKEFPKLLADLNDGIASNDASTMKRAAHTIRGNLRVFGDTEAGNHAEQIEALARAAKTQEIAGLLPTFHAQLASVLSEVKRRFGSRSPA